MNLGRASALGGAIAAFSVIAACAPPAPQAGTPSSPTTPPAPASSPSVVVASPVASPAASPARIAGGKSRRGWPVGLAQPEPRRSLGHSKSVGRSARRTEVACWAPGSGSPRRPAMARPLWPPIRAATRSSSWPTAVCRFVPIATESLGATRSLATRSAFNWVRRRSSAAHPTRRPMPFWPDSSQPPPSR